MIRRVGTALLVATGVAGPAAVPARAQSSDSVVWVYLSPDTAPAAPVALAPASLERRAREGIPLFANDAPIREERVAALEAAGLRVRHRSRWLRAVSGSADAAAIARIRALDFVARVAPVRSIGAPPQPRPAPAVGPPFAAVAPPDSFYGRALAQVRQIGVPAAHDMGFTGAGVIVALLDTGFEREHETLAGLSVLAARDFIQGDTVVENEAGDSSGQADHGTWVWSVLGGYSPNTFVGPAWEANFLLAKVDDVPTETRADEDRWVAAIEWADSLGAQVINSSLGYLCFPDCTDPAFRYQFADLNGDVTPTTVAADEAARRGILVVNAVGNEGRTAGSLVAPADADSIIAVGAVDENGMLAPFSSRGPTADGRIKPELVARGVSTSAASSTDPTRYVTRSGTSLATPLVAGGAALFIEAWRDIGLGGMAARHALLLSGSIRPPNDSMGYGLPDVASAILFPQGLEPLPSSGNGPGERLRTLAPSFAWSVPLLHTLARPVRYRLQIASDPGFLQIVAEDTITDAQVLTLSRPLRAAPQLWWRVVAETAPGIVRTSQPAGPFSMEAWVELVTLNESDGVFISNPTPVLTWDPLPAPAPVGPLEYKIDIFAASNGAVIQSLDGIEDTTVTVPDALPFNQPLRWRVIVRSAAGVVDTVQNLAPFVVVSTAAPPVTLLYQNFPNPFPRAAAPNTTIWFDLSVRTRVSLRVYDLRGRLVRRLIPDARQGCTGVRQLDVGVYGRDGNPDCVATTWDGRTDAGDALPPGVYLIRLTTDEDAYTVRTLFRP